MYVSGTSKAATNFITGRIHKEHESVYAIAIHPGFTQSDMGNEAARSWGLEKAPDTLEETTEGMMKLINEGKRQEKVQFADFKGGLMGW